MSHKLQIVPHADRESAEGSAGTATVGASPIALAWSIVTISRPNGSRETGVSLKFASPSGMPMIVKHSSIPVRRCPSARHLQCVLMSGWHKVTLSDG